jgi:hypothetical protein
MGLSPIFDGSYIDDHNDDDDDDDEKLLRTVNFHVLSLLIYDTKV